MRSSPGLTWGNPVGGRAGLASAAATPPEKRTPGGNQRGVAHEFAATALGCVAHRSAPDACLITTLISLIIAASRIPLERTQSYMVARSRPRVFIYPARTLHAAAVFLQARGLHSRSEAPSASSRAGQKNARTASGTPSNAACASS